MKTAHVLTTTCAAVLIGAAHTPAVAQSEPLKSREQVRQEMMEAIRTGNMPCKEDSGRMLKDAYPGQYPRK